MILELVLALAVLVAWLLLRRAILRHRGRVVLPPEPLNQIWKLKTSAGDVFVMPQRVLDQFVIVEAPPHFPLGGSVELWRWGLGVPVRVLAEPDHPGRGW